MLTKRGSSNDTKSHLISLFHTSHNLPPKKRALMTTVESSLAYRSIPAETRFAEVRVCPFGEEDASSWEQYVRSHPDGSFFHQLAWKKVIEKTYKYRSLYFCAKRGERITGIAPSFLISSWMTGRRLISLPFAVYGGICADDCESEQALISHLEKLAADLDSEYLELRYRGAEVRQGYHLNPRYATFTMPINGDVEAMYKALPKDIRYMIRKGEKAALRAEHGLHQLDIFYELVTLNLHRLGTPVFPLKLFENLICEYASQVNLTVIYSGNDAVAGAMCFCFREWMQPYYVGATEDAKTLAANDFLWWELIKLAAVVGYAIFDFGRSKKNSG